MHNPNRSRINNRKLETLCENFMILPLPRIKVSELRKLIDHVHGMGSSMTWQSDDKRDI